LVESLLESECERERERKIGTLIEQKKRERLVDTL
jgi:hypothetical protein